MQQQQQQQQQRELPIVTELSNHITRNIDIVGSSGIVRLLRQCDAQIFGGWEEHVGLNDSAFVEGTMDQLLRSILLLQDRGLKTMVVMTGAGTSGRLAFHCARSYNRLAKELGRDTELRFEYLMAGSDVALMKSVEKAEDDVTQPVLDLKRLVYPSNDNDNSAIVDHVLYVGITCGLSAPYIGSQLDWLLNEETVAANNKRRPTWTVTLMGFNDASVARKMPIEGWNKTMFDVVSQLRQRIDSEIANGDNRRHFILNPIVGPEPITGSSRMKSGTTTKLLLDAIATGLLSLRSSHKRQQQQSTFFPEIFSWFERVNRATYLPEQQLSKIVEVAGETLRSEGGHIYYVSEEGNLSLLGLIDASECPPTFGALFTDIRGFVVDGWATLQNREGDLSTVVPHFRISDSDFQTDIVPSLSSRDLVVVLHSYRQSTSRVTELIKSARAACSSVGLILANWSRPTASQEVEEEEEVDQPLNRLLEAIGDSLRARIDIKLPFHDIPLDDNRDVHFGALLEMSAKWFYNCLSTGAHVLKGKIYGNKMVDLCLSNNKLYHRGIGLVSSMLNVPEDDAKLAVLKAIHNTDTVTDQILAYPISTHYQVAVNRPKVIPISILLASGAASTIQEAEITLSKEPILRNTLLSVLKKQ